MAEGNDTSATKPADDADIAMLQNIIEATGLPRETVEDLLMTDSDLDDLCEAVLSQLATPAKKPGSAKTPR